MRKIIFLAEYHSQAFQFKTRKLGRKSLGKELFKTKKIISGVISIVWIWHHFKIEPTCSIKNKRIFHNIFNFSTNFGQTWCRVSKLDSYFRLEKWFWEGFRTIWDKNHHLGRFSTKRLLEIALPWQHLKSQVIKNYLKGFVILCQPYSYLAFLAGTLTGWWRFLSTPC